MKIEKDELIFSTGTRIDKPNAGFIGINEDFDISEGYDGYIWLKPNLCEDWDKPGHGLTPQELVELGEYMIDLWTKFTATANILRT